MTSKAEAFCRDRRLYDVRRGVTYLRRTEELAQRQWRHFGAVPPIRTHVIRDVGLSTMRADVTDAERSETATDQPSDGGCCSGQHADHTVREEKGRGLANDALCLISSVSKANNQGSEAVLRGFTENNFRYQTRVLEESTDKHPLISITEVTEILHTATPTREYPGDGARLTLARQHHHQHPDHQQLHRKPSVGLTADRREARQETSVSPTLTTQQVPGQRRQEVPMSRSDDATPSQTTLTDRPTSPASHGCPGSSRQMLPSGDERQTVTNTSSNKAKAVLYVARESLGGDGQEGSGGDGGGDPFNTWGSRHWDVEVKLQEELKPKNYSPKRYPPQSRVSSYETQAARNKRRRRQQRIMTDFRSRNGTVCIIKPLPPVIDSKKTFRRPLVSDDPDDDFDIDDLARERTYVMLQRIDRLLEPAKACFPSHLSSTEREVCSSSTSTAAASLGRSPSVSKDEDFNQEEVNQTVETEKEVKDNINTEVFRKQAEVKEHSPNGIQDLPLNRTTVSLKRFYEKPVRVVGTGSRGDANEVTSDTTGYGTVLNPDETPCCGYRQPNLDPRIPQIFLQERAGHRASKSHKQDSSLLSKFHQPHLGPDFDATGRGELFQMTGDESSRLQVPLSSDPQPERSNVFYPLKVAESLWPEPPHAQHQQHALHGRNSTGLSCLIHPKRSFHSLDFCNHHPHLSRGQVGRGSRQALVEARGQGWRVRGEGMGQSVEEVVAKLERRRVDLHGKCEAWVKRCAGYFKAADTLLL